MMTEKDTMQVKPEKKEDRRVRRTKKLLTHGLIQLMKEKQVQDITCLLYTSPSPRDA